MHAFSITNAVVGEEFSSLSLIFEGGTVLLKVETV